MRLPSTVLALTLPPLLACMASPRDDTAVCGEEEVFDFSGVTQGPRTVQVEASASEAGPFAALGTTAACPAPYLGFGLGVLGGVHEWRLSSASGAWGTERGARVTYLRARAQVGRQWIPLTTFEEGTPPQTSDRSPLVRITAPPSSTCDCPTSFSGDVVIASGPDARRFACLTEIDGRLIVTEDAPASFALPNLALVTGDVQLDLSSFCSRPEDQYRAVELPALTTVGGDLRVEARLGALLVGPVVNVGLDAVTSVGGDVSVQVPGNANVIIAGLGALAEAPGSVTVVATGDLSATNLLPQLASVGGDVTIQSGSTTAIVLPAVVSVAGSVLIKRSRTAGPSFVLPSLESVLGDMVLEDAVFFDDTPKISALAFVGGTYAVRTAPESPTLWAVGPGDLSVLGAAPLDVGGLEIDRVEGMTQLGAALQVATGGAITITGNPDLETCEAESFAAQQAAAGWTGPLTIAGNLGGGCP